MSDKTIEIKLENGQRELILRTGEAEKVRQQRGFEETTTHEGMVDFYTKRKEFYNGKNTSLIVGDVFEAGNVLELRMNDMLKEETVILKVYQETPKDVAELGLNNAERSYNFKTLAEVLRNRPHLFTSELAYKDFFTVLRNSTMKVNSARTSKDDRAGNVENSVVNAVETSMPSCWDLVLPMDASQTSGEVVSVNIEIEVLGSEVRFYLVSPKYIINQRAWRLAACETVVKAFREFGVPVL